MAQLDPSIILSGRQPDIVGTLANATQAGQQQRQFNERNALNAYLQQNGSQVMGGDQNALNGLSRFGVDGLNAAQGVQQNALGMEQTRLGMDATRQNMQLAQSQEGRLSRQEERQIQEHAASMSAAERNAAIAGIESAVAAGMAARSPEEWDALMSQQEPSLVGQFDQREMVGSGLLSVADAMKRADARNNPASNEPATIAALRIRAQEAGLQPGTQEYQQFMANGGVPPQNTSLSVDPNTGGVTFTQGTGEGGAPKFTEGQSKDNVYATRAQGALAVLEPVVSTLTSRMDRAADMDPTGLTRGLQDPDFQVAKQAGDEFLQAILSKDTGAAITQQEQDAYGTTFLPRPGDSPEVMEAKRASRIRAVAAINAGRSAQQILATERALEDTAAQVGAPQNAPVSGQITADSVRAMTPEAASQYMMTTPLDQIPDDVIDALIERGQ